MKKERIIINSVAFLSGCFPVALIYLLANMLFDKNRQDWYVNVFANSFFFITVISMILFWWILRKWFKGTNETVTIKHIRRKDIFSSGAISYYILPFVSFINNDEKSVLILLIVLILLLIIFINNMMFLYTPFIDILGYKILECDMEIDGKCEKITIVFKDTSALFFTGINEIKINKIDEGIFCGMTIEK